MFSKRRYGEWNRYLCESTLRLLSKFFFTRTPTIAEEIKNQVDSKGVEFAKYYQEGISQGFLKDIPLELASLWFFRAMLTTISYIKKFESEKTEAEQLEISGIAFNNYLYGVRV